MKPFLLDRLRRTPILLTLLVLLASSGAPASGHQQRGQETVPPPDTRSVGPSGGDMPPMGNVDVPQIGLPTAFEIPVEVSAVLVIDVSGSMGSNNKMADAKIAAKETLARFLTLGVDTSSTTLPAATQPPATTPSGPAAPNPRGALLDSRMQQFDTMVEALEKLQREAGNPADWGPDATKRMRAVVAQMDELMKGVVLEKSQPALQRLNPLLEKMHFAIAGKVNKAVGGGHRYMVSGKKSAHPDFGGLYSTKMSDHDAIYVGPRADDARAMHSQLAGEMYGPDWLQRTDSCMESGTVTFGEATTHPLRRERFRGFEVGPGSNNDWMRTRSGGRWVVDYVVEKGEIVELDELVRTGDPDAAGVRRGLGEALDDIRRAGVSFETRRLTEEGYYLGAVSDFERQYSLNVARRAAAGERAGAAVLQMEKYFPRLRSMMEGAGGSITPELTSLLDDVQAAKKIVNAGQDVPDLASLQQRFDAFRSQVRAQAATQQVQRYEGLVGDAQRALAAGDQAGATRLLETADELLDDVQGALHNYDQLGRSGQGDLVQDALASMRGASGGTTFAESVERSFRDNPWIVNETTIADAVASEPVRGLNPTRRFQGGILRTLEDAKDYVARNPGTSFVYVAGLGYAASGVYDAYARHDYNEAWRLGIDVFTSEVASLAAEAHLAGQAGASAGVGGFLAGLTAGISYNVGYWASKTLIEQRANWRAQQTATDLLAGFTSDNRRPPGHAEGFLDALGLPVDDSRLLDAFQEGTYGDVRVEVDENTREVTISRRKLEMGGGMLGLPHEVWEPETISFAELRLRAQLDGAYQNLRDDYKGAIGAGSVTQDGVVRDSYEYGTGMDSLGTFRIPNPGGLLTQSEFDFYRKRFDEEFGRYTLNQNADLENLFRTKAEMFQRTMNAVIEGKQKDHFLQQRLDSMSPEDLEALKAMVEKGAAINLDGARLTPEEIQARADRARELRDGALGQAIADFYAEQESITDETRKQVDVLTSMTQLGRAGAGGEFEFAILAYSGGCDEGNDYRPFTREYQPLAEAIDALSSGGGTPMTPALYQADRIIQVDGKGTRGVIVLLTDGQNSCGASPTEAADHIFRRSVAPSAPGGPIGGPFLLVTPAWLQAAAPAPGKFAGYQKINQTYGTVPAGRGAIPVTVSAIGFQVSDSQQAELEAVAAAGGGQAVRAENAAELAGAFQAAVGSAAPVRGGGGGGVVVRRGRGPSWGALLLVLLVVANGALAGGIVWLRRARRAPARRSAPPATVQARRTVQLTVHYPDGGTKEGTLDVTRTAVLGRDPACDLALNDPSVSARHAELIVSDRGLRVRDLGSTCGTKVNGERVAEATLQAGDRLALGDTELIIGRIDV